VRALLARGSIIAPSRTNVNFSSSLSAVNDAVYRQFGNTVFVICNVLVSFIFYVV